MIGLDVLGIMSQSSFLVLIGLLSGSGLNSCTDLSILFGLDVL